MDLRVVTLSPSGTHPPHHEPQSGAAELRRDIDGVIQAGWEIPDVVLLPAGYFWLDSTVPPTVAALAAAVRSAGLAMPVVAGIDGEQGGPFSGILYPMFAVVVQDGQSAGEILQQACVFEEEADYVSAPHAQMDRRVADLPDWDVTVGMMICGEVASQAVWDALVAGRPRLIAHLAHSNLSRGVAFGKWLPWLQDLSTDGDCLVALAVTAMNRREAEVAFKSGRAQLPHQELVVPSGTVVREFRLPCGPAALPAVVNALRDRWARALQDVAAEQKGVTAEGIATRPALVWKVRPV